ncbi:hypothetical protein B0H14DRAFT_3876934 [Mycena olivaceomarginata]|nr:hypothetical protein B0H14DRAFT_3876934 [Mycena olivaceomarginata]
MTSSSTSRYGKLTKLPTLRRSIVGRARSSFRDSEDRWKARLELSAIRSSVPVVPPDNVGLATFMAWPRVLHGMPIRDLWAPPQLGLLPTRVAMYFPTPSAEAVDRSLFHRPVPAPFADAVCAVQLPLQSAILLIVALTYPFLLHSLVTPL